MRIDKLAVYPSSVGRSDYSHIVYFLDFPSQMGIILEVDDISKPQDYGDPLMRSQIYLSVFKEYGRFEADREATANDLQSAGDKYEEDIKPDKMFWRVLEKEAEYGEGSTKQQIMKLVF